MATNASGSNASDGNATLPALPASIGHFDADETLARYNLTVDLVIAVGATGELFAVLLVCYCCHLIVTECAYAVGDACYELCHSWACTWFCRVCRAKLCCSSSRPVRGLELGELGDETESDDNGGDGRSQTFVSGAADRVAE